MINVYHTYIHDELPPQKINAFLQVFPNFIQFDINRYLKWQDRQLVLFGKILLLEALNNFGYHEGLENLKYTEYKRPYIDNCFDFNISHSNQISVLVFSQSSRVGIDIEKIREVDLNDFRSVMDDVQNNLILSSNNKYETFFDLWTMKESFIKALGKGLFMPIRDIRCERDGYILQENKKWYYKKININPSYACFVTSDHPIENINVVEKKSIFLNLKNNIL